MKFGGDEQDLRQIERHTEIVIGEGVVLRRIEHFEEGRGRIALERDAQLVHFVEQEDRVLRSRLLHALNDPSGHGTHIRPPVAADIGLIPRPAQ